MHNRRGCNAITCTTNGQQQTLVTSDHSTIPQSEGGIFSASGNSGVGRGHVSGTTSGTDGDGGFTKCVGSAGFQAAIGCNSQLLG